MKFVKVETLKPVRLNGSDIEAGELIDLEESLLTIWLLHGNAKIPDKTKSGSKNSSKNAINPEVVITELPVDLVPLEDDFFQLPNGDKVQGKTEALAAYEALKAAAELPVDLVPLEDDFFELPNGDKVQGKTEALAAYEALKAAGGGVDGAKTDNAS
ncbi:MAG: hypothetical protein JWM44_1194 [Bacilli bacterium]|nr:hypothetical protein [Bacilli bacterium]